MRYIKILLQVLPVISMISFSGCMEEINVSTEPGYNSAADLLTYLETNGDFINSDKNPAFVDADQVYANYDKYLLLDVRSPSEFSDGHIENSINLPLESLIETIESKDIAVYPMIVIISASGQKASYAASLLRMYGFNTVYSLEYGIGQWNEKFSEVWKNARADARYAGFLIRTSYAKPLLKKQLPLVTFDDISVPTEELVKQRIRSLLTEVEYQNSIASTDEYEDMFSYRHREYAGAYFICYGGLDLYNYIKILKNGYDPPKIIGSHIRGTVYYNPANDFKASTYLLTIPINEQIFIYSYNGQRSAFITAYLRVLGYPARSILFGAVSMFYYELSFKNDERSLWDSNIRNYPYVN